MIIKKRNSLQIEVSSKKGISFALNFKEQAERFINKKYDY